MKVTPIVQVEFAASEPVQVVVSAKSVSFVPVIVKGESVIAEVPVLVNVTVWGVDGPWPRIC